MTELAKKKSFSWVGIFALVFMFFQKQAVLYKALQAFKLLKVAKPLLMLGSIVISVIAYGWLYGSWWFAIGFVIMIFIHEMGHIIAMRLQGLPAAPMMFIPFIGAAIFTPEMKRRQTEAVIGIGGPILGTIGAVAAFLLWIVYPGEHSILLLVSYMGLVLNLFNMIPVSPLDGGRITQVCGEWIKYVGLALVLALLGYTKLPSILLIVILVMDAFKMKRWLRPAIATVLFVSMITMFILGYEQLPVIVMVIDSIVGFGFVILYFMGDNFRNDQVLKIYEDEQEITPTIRWKWFGYWLALVVFLIGTLVVQTKYLPEKIQIQAQERIAD